jgi:hypothetical protein
MASSSAEAGLQAAHKQELNIVGTAWGLVFEVLWAFRNSKAACSGGSCSCLNLQAGLHQLLETVAQLRPKLETLTKLRVECFLPAYCSYIPDCPHAAATRLAIADAYYK